MNPRSVYEAQLRLGLGDQTARQMVILHSLVADGGEPSVKDLAARYRLAKPAVTRALKTLSTLGYIRREKHRDDDRLIAVFATDKGREIVRELAEAAAKGGE